MFCVYRDPTSFSCQPFACLAGEFKKKPKTTQPRSVRALFSFIRGAAIGGIAASQIIQKHFRWKFCWSSCDALPAIENATPASWCSEVYPCFFLLDTWEREGDDLSSTKAVLEKKKKWKETRALIATANNCEWKTSLWEEKGNTIIFSC